MKEIKVCFSSWHFQTSKIFLDYLRKLTPSNSGVWTDTANNQKLVGVDTPEEADFIIVYDGTRDPRVDLKKAFLFGQHPKVDTTPYNNHGGDLSPSFTRFANEAKRGYLKVFSLDKYWNPGEWWIDYTYDQLVNLKAEDVKKEKDLCCVMTYQLVNPMYAQRVLFMNALTKEFDKYDLYGRDEKDFLNDPVIGNCYIGPLGSNNPDGSTGEHTKGKNIISKYRYSLEFDVGPTKNYISERFYDALLLWNMPLYFGSENVGDILPKEALYYIDITKTDDAVEETLSIIGSDERERNIDAIAEARDLLLNKYQTWAMVSNIISKL